MKLVSSLNSAAVPDNKESPAFSSIGPGSVGPSYRRSGHLFPVLHQTVGNFHFDDDTLTAGFDCCERRDGGGEKRCCNYTR